MSIYIIGFIAAVVLTLLVAGIVVGWVIGSNDTQIEILSRRLIAEQRINDATRQTLHAMRDAVRRHSR